jgi:hypothetical protein
LNNQEYLKTIYGLVPGVVTPEINPSLLVKMPSKGVLDSLSGVRVPYGLSHSLMRTFYIQPWKEYKRHDTFTS